MELVTIQLVTINLFNYKLVEQRLLRTFSSWLTFPPQSFAVNKFDKHCSRTNSTQDLLILSTFDTFL